MRGASPVVVAAAGAFGLLATLGVAVAAVVAGAPGGAVAALTPTAAGAAGPGDIPPVYLDAFDRAAAGSGVPWSILAGIYRVECDFGRSPLPGCRRGTANGAGAQGPGQFLPGTWRAGMAPRAIIAPGPPAPAGTGYATDGDGDGVADPWDPFDAAASTARLLGASGAASDIARAVFAYNHDAGYVDQVLALAAGYQRERAALPVGGPGARPGAPAPGSVEAVLAFAAAQFGRPYQWGGSGPAWDCSGLVQAAYRQAGVVLTHDAAAQYAATASRPVALAALRAGDLVFYGASPATIHHVGIAVDASHMVDAPHTGAVVRIDPVGAADLLAATRPLG